MKWLSCLCAPALQQQISQTSATEENRTANDPLPCTRTLLQTCKADGLPDATLNDLGGEEPSLALEQNISAAFSQLYSVGGEYPLYQRVNALLETCRVALGASDARLAFFSPNGSAWVFLSSPIHEPDAVPRAAGWAPTPLYYHLYDQPNTAVAIRGYHRESCKADDANGAWQRATSVRPQSSLSPNSTANSTNVGMTATPSTPATTPAAQISSISLTGDKSLRATPPSATVTASLSRTTPPDPSSLVVQPMGHTMFLHPTDLLALPALYDSQLAVALLVGWDSPLSLSHSGISKTAAEAQGSGESNENSHSNSKGSSSRGKGRGVEVRPAALSQLRQLAQMLVFALMCDPGQARAFQQMARRFSTLPMSNGLHDFIACLLDAVPEIIYTRFTVRMQAIMVLTHGSNSGPAVLFASRHRAQNAHRDPDASLPASGHITDGGPLGDAPNRAAAESAMALETWASNRGGGAGLASFLCSPEEGGDLPPSRIRAVRISLHHTLLAEALRSTAKRAADATACKAQQLHHRQSVNATGAIGSHVLGTAAGGTASGPGGAAVPGLMQLAFFSVGNSPSGQACLSSGPEPAAQTPHANGSTFSASTRATPHYTPPPPPPSSQRLLPPAQPLYSTIVSNIASHMLEEASPCRDVLLCSNLMGCGAMGLGSLILCLEAAAPAPNATGAGGTTLTSSPGWAANGASAPIVRAGLTPPPMVLPGEGGRGDAGSGGGGTPPPFSLSMAGGTGAAASLPPPQLSYHGGAYAAVQSTPSPGVLGPMSGVSSATSMLAALNALSPVQGAGGGGTATMVTAPPRQFGMYLVCAEPLPTGVLRCVASELQMLLGMALGACRDSALGTDSRGNRCAFELLGLQEQMLGIQLIAPGGPSASVAGNTCSGGGGGGGGVSSGIAASTGPVPSVALGSTSVSGPRVSVLGRRVAQGRPMPRSLFALAAGAAAAGGIRSASSERMPSSHHVHLAAGSTGRDSTNRRCGGGGRDSEAGVRPGDEQDGMGRGSGVEALEEFSEVLGAGATRGVDSADVGTLNLMLASSPEVLLEAPAAGPSPLELMVTSMRSGLTAALTSAMLLESMDETRAALSQELASIRLCDVIGRGGQGVVFHGTLHGLETAVKVIVHRGKGEPLAHDAGDEVERGGEGEGDGRALGEAAGGGGEADGEGPSSLSRIRKAKRGAMELVVTGTLSHPNIVQVLASFSDVIMVRCTFRNETTPRLRLVAKDDPILATWSSPGPLNTVVCLEYCDVGTLLEAAQAGAFRPPGSSVLSGAVRPALVPLYMSLLEVALALRYLHSRRLVHCDLKPSNVLLKSSARDPRGWTCKLSDFGCVRLLTELPANSPNDLQRTFPKPSQHLQNRRNTVLGFQVAQPLGTIAYMAPECFVKGQTLGASTDIYAFGILMFELLMCRAPYSGIDAQNLPRMVLRQHLRPEFHPLAPPEYCHLAARCWSSQVSRRPTAIQLVAEIETLLTAVQHKEDRKQQELTSVTPTSGSNRPSSNLHPSHLAQPAQQPSRLLPTAQPQSKPLLQSRLSAKALPPQKVSPTPPPAAAAAAVAAASPAAAPSVVASVAEPYRLAPLSAAGQACRDLGMVAVVPEVGPIGAEGVAVAVAVSEDVTVEVLHPQVHM